MKAKQTIWLGTFVLVLFVPLLIWSQTGWQEEQVAVSSIPEHNQDIVMDLDGNVHIVYLGDEVVGKGRNRRTVTNAYYAFRANTDTWSESIQLGESRTAEIAFGGGLAHIVFGRKIGSDPYQAQLFYWNPNLSDPVEISTTGLNITPDNPDIVAESNGQVHIAFIGWHDRGSEIYYTSGNGTSFNNPVAVESEATDRHSQAPSIDVNESGEVVGITFGRVFGENRGLNSVFYTSNVLGYFFEPKDIISPGGDDGFWQNWPELKVGDGGAYIFYPQSNPNYTCCDNPGRRDLYYTKLNAVDGTTIVSPVNFAQRVQVNFNGAGSISYDTDKVYLTYWDYKEISGKKNSTWQPKVQYLVLNANNGGIFSGPEVVAENGYEPSLDFDGEAHISFTRQSDVFYATNAGSGPPPPQGTECFVQNISMSLSYKGGKPSNRGWTATATVLVQDDLGNPVSGATVSGHWSGLTSDNDNGTTGSDGRVSVDSDRINATGTFTFTVTNVSHGSLTYNDALNEMTSNSISNLSKSIADVTVLNSMPSEFQLLQNYPNPFNPETTISYQLPEQSQVSLKIYNFSGQLVRILYESNQPAGNHSVVWDGMDDAGQNVSSGVYVVRMFAGIYSASQKISLIR